MKKPIDNLNKFSWRGLLFRRTFKRRFLYALKFLMSLFYVVIFFIAVLSAIIGLLFILSHEIYQKIWPSCKNG